MRRYLLAGAVRTGDRVRKLSGASSVDAQGAVLKSTGIRFSELVKFERM